MVAAHQEGEATDFRIAYNANDEARLAEHSPVAQSVERVTVKQSPTDPPPTSTTQGHEKSVVRQGRTSP